MSFGTLNRLRKTIGFRLALWFSLLFIASSLILFGLTYLFLSSYARHEDRQNILSELAECRNQYLAGGIPALNKEVDLESLAGDEAFFVRLLGVRHQTLFLSTPARWTPKDLDRLGALIDPNTGWASFRPESTKNLFEIISVFLSDGTVLQVGKGTEHRQDLAERFGHIFAAVMVPLILLGFIGGILVAFRALRPIRNLIDTVRFIDRGTMSARVPFAHTGDELDELAVLFNRMLEKIGRLIDGMHASLDNVAHDLRTPLTRLQGISELALQTEPGVEALREALMDCAEESHHVLTMLNSLMDISEAETGAMRLEMERVDLSALLEDTVELYRYVAEDKGVSVNLAVPEGLSLTADRNRLRQVMANLLDNAIKYTPVEGKIEIRAHARGEQVVIVVEDTGEGIAAEDLPKIWERLFRGDKSRSQRGLGLGLSLVRAVVCAHQGNIEVASEPGKGSQFIVHLPQA
jgi:signal transduction histidine kinase